MLSRDAIRYRYDGNDTRPFFLNSEHYTEAYRVCTDFADRVKEKLEEPPLREADTLIEQVPMPRVHDENRLLPVDGYFSFYSDLLGFTKEVCRGGMDSLPDYYGGALFAASQNPTVQVYMFSDSCFATTAAENLDGFIPFISMILGVWLSNGLIPQCSVGYGSFVERKPTLAIRAPNFFGTQIAGTALADAANLLLKDEKPPGSRVLVSPSAWRRWPQDQRERIVRVGEDKELLTRRPWTHCLFDCVYYLLCLREHKPDTRAFEHYAWSFASRVKGGGIQVGELSRRLMVPCYGDARSHLEAVIRRISAILKVYGFIFSSESRKATR